MGLLNQNSFHIASTKKVGNQPPFNGLGHKAQTQNGFGAFKDIEYFCTFNADTGELLSTNFQ